MNATVKEAKQLDEWNQNLPDVEIGDIVRLGEIWKGDGAIPTESYTYTLVNEPWKSAWLDYRFEVVQENKKDPLETLVKVTDISLL